MIMHSVSYLSVLLRHDSHSVSCLYENLHNISTAYNIEHVLFSMGVDSSWWDSESRVILDDGSTRVHFACRLYSHTFCMQTSCPVWPGLQNVLTELCWVKLYSHYGSGSGRRRSPMRASLHASRRSPRHRERLNARLSAHSNACLEAWSTAF